MGIREEILIEIRQAKPGLAKKYKVKSIALFGSLARNEGTPESDIDILVDFSEPIGIEFVYLSDELETILKRKVDLVSRTGVKDHYYKQIEKDLIYA